MKNIMVDMDDVIVCGLVQKLIEDYLGEKIELDKNTSFYLQDLLGDKKDDFLAKLKSINIYEGASLVPDAYDVLKRLNENNKVYIVTDYIWREIPEYGGSNLKNKFDFLYRELDFLTPDRFIFAPDKSIIKSDIGIDDKINNLISSDKKILYTAYHNSNILDDELYTKGIIRANSWKEVEDIILREV